jgi:prolipoprotein diacylglyceryltransferase
VTPTLIHLVVDSLAAACAMAVTMSVYRWRLRAAGDRVAAIGLPYAAALVAGAVLGAYLAGTINLWVSGQAGIGRSILGALAGAVVAIELYKHVNGIRGSTGVIFAPAFATSIIIGRVGCFLSGLDDFTYGTATTLPWGTDFGDGIRRHPVQLYEAAVVAVFMIAALALLGWRSAWFSRNGFYLLVAVYATQRFIWEFLKPYGTVVGPFNIFHILAAGLTAYAVVMICRRSDS